MYTLNIIYSVSISSYIDLYDYIYITIYIVIYPEDINMYEIVIQGPTKQQVQDSCF